MFALIVPLVTGHLSRGYYSVDSNLTSGTVNGGGRSAKPNVIFGTITGDSVFAIKKDIFIYSFILRLSTGYRIKDILSDFRVYDRKAMKTYLTLEGREYGSAFSLLVFMKHNFKIVELENSVHYSLHKIRPFPFDGLVRIRISFLRSLFRVSPVRSAAAFPLSVLLLFGTLLINLLLFPQFNSLRPKRLLRK